MGWLANLEGTQDSGLLASELTSFDFDFLKSKIFESEKLKLIYTIFWKIIFWLNQIYSFFHWIDNIQLSASVSEWKLSLQCDDLMHVHNESRKLIYNYEL